MATTSASAPTSHDELPVGYWRLLRGNSNFRNLWFGQLINAAGDWFNNVAVLGLALQLTGNGLAAGLVLLASSIPFFVLMPIAGPVADRFDRRKIMLIANCFGAVLALTFLLVRDSSMVWLLFVGSFLLIGVATFFNPAAQASVPNIVRPNELYSANALSSSTWGIMVFVGSGLGGLASSLLGRDLVFVLNSISFLIANLFIWRVKLPPRDLQTTLENRPGYWQEFREGLGYLRTHLPVLALCAVKSGWGLAGGLLVLLSVFGEQIFKAGDAGIGLLYAGRGFGALIGPLLLARLVGERGPIRLYIIISFFVTAIGYGLFGLIASLGLSIFIAVLAVTFAHMGGGTNWVLSAVAIQKRVPDNFRGRITATDLGLSTLTTSLSTLIWSLALLWQASPILLAFIGVGVLSLYAVIWAIVTAKGSFDLRDEVPITTR